MKNVVARISMTYVAYVSLLMGFVALGIFVYALAVGSSLTGVIAGSLAVLFTAAVVGFRRGARTVAEADESGNPIDGANVLAQPVRSSRDRAVPAELPRHRSPSPTRQSTRPSSRCRVRRRVRPCTST